VSVIVADTAKSGSEARWLARAGSILLGLPPVIVIVGLFLCPVGLILLQSVFIPHFDLAEYRHIFQTPLYWTVFSISLRIALFSTIISLVASYLVASSLLFVRPLTRSVMLAIILVPFWTNVLIRCYAWILILQKNGVANLLLVQKLHIFSQPLSLLFNIDSVLIGMVHYLIPINILILYTAMQRIDLRLLQAAKGLGANPLLAMLHVFLPLSMPGVFASSMLVFVISLGFFVAPALLGGPREITIAMQINSSFTDTVDWALGSALAVILLVVTLVFIAGYLTLQRKQATR